MAGFWKIALLLPTVLHPTLGHTPPPTEDKLANCLLASIAGLTSRTPLRISIEVENATMRRSFEDTVSRFLSKNDAILVDIDIHSQDLCRVFIQLTFVDSTKSFRTLVDRQRNRNCLASNVNHYYLVVLPSSLVLATVEEILSFCSKVYILNVNILIADKDVTLYTYYPFTQSSCRGSTPTINNRFVNGTFKWNRQLFPPKIDNLWQCPIKAIVWNHPPFLWFTHNQVDGINGDIFKTLAAMMNFSIETVISPGGRGIFYPNNSATGSFELLKDGVGDLSLGSSDCRPNRRAHFAATGPLYSGHLYGLVKRPKRYRSVDALVLPFDWTMWLSLSTLLLAKWIGQLLWKNQAGRFVAFRCCSTRLHTMAWLYAMFIVRSSYEGSIFRFLKNRPVAWIPHDIHEAVDNGYKFIGHPHYYTGLCNLPQLSDNLVFYNVSMSNLVTVLDTFTGRYAVLVSDLSMSSFNNDPVKSENYALVPTSIVKMDFCIEMQSYSFLTEAFNTRIQSLFANGFMNRNYVKHAQKDNLLRKGKSERGRISVHHIKGALLLLSMFTVVGTVIFAVELLAGRCSWLRKLLEVFT